MKGLTNGIIAAAVLLTLVACGEDEVILAGVREPIRPQEDVSQIPVNRVEPISLTAPRLNAEWTHKGGTPTHAIAHPVLSQQLSLIWSTNIGEGESLRARISADPIVAANRIFVMDAESLVSAVDRNGQILWSTDLTPPGENPGDGLGGGLAFSAGRVFATSGYGSVVAMNASNGAVLWEQKLEAGASAAPTVVDGVVYLTSRNGTGWAINAETGRILWEVLGVSTDRGLVGGPAPVLSGNEIVFPFGSGQMVAADRRTGERRWQASVSGERPDRVLALVRDMTGDPVVIGRTLFAGTHAGRTGAFSTDGGQPLWTLEEGAMSQVWVEGGSVFLLTDENRLIRVNARTGEVVWRVALPFFVPERRERNRKTAYAHFGPIMAGGRLLVVSDDELMRSFDPASGAILSTQELPSGAASDPVVAGGTLYVVTEDGNLNAFR